MTFSSPSDSRLAAKALRENWPMAPEQRRAAIEHLQAVVAAEDTRPQLMAIAQKALATVEPMEATR
jgi:hypothetical protein